MAQMWRINQQRLWSLNRWAVLAAAVAILWSWANSSGLSGHRDRYLVYSYSPQTLPNVYWSQSRGLFPVGYNEAGPLDETGSANNEHPWRHAGGTDDCGPDVSVKRYLFVPRGRMIKVWRETRRVVLPNGVLKQVRYLAGRYPRGTRAIEEMYDDGRLFERRERKKTGRGRWVTLQERFGAVPAGFVEVDNCTDCHKDIGTHSRELDHTRDWYGTVRGLERHGPIHWHPWSVEGLGATAIPARIRNDVRHFVKWR